MSSDSKSVNLLRNDEPELNFGFGGRVDPLSGRHVDEAVDSAISESGVPESVGRMLRELLARDANSEVANAYFADINARGTARTRTRMRKALININYCLSDSQIVTLTDYAPEYELCFRNFELHDHPMAAAMRMLDHAIINSRIPARAKVTDVGGDPLYHIVNGHVNVHCCDPVFDVKDDSRRTVREMAVRNILRNPKGRSAETILLANRFVVKDEASYCTRVAQECPVSSDVITAVHVYDVPMESWPYIMEKKGACLVEGALIFTDKFFVEPRGELFDSGVRYAIDIATDEFRMGFVDSPSWWYRHKWSDFLRYGVDQRIVHGDRVYSYKIVERRKDTIFFRILAVGKRPEDKKPWFWRNRDIQKDFLYPEVRMVEINGFDFDSTGERSSRMILKRKSFMVAVPLWEALVNVASMDFERGVLDFQKMFNAYRTLAPRHTINGVLVSGGYSVEVKELVSVVIHASVVGAMRVSVAEKTNRAITATAFETRLRLTSSTAGKLISALCSVGCITLYAGASLTGVPQLVQMLKLGIENNSLLDFIGETYDPVVRSISVKKIFNKLGPTGTERTGGGWQFGSTFSTISAEGLLHDIVDAATREYNLAKFLLDNLGDSLSSFNKDRLERAVIRLAPNIERALEAPRPSIGNNNANYLTELPVPGVKPAVVEGKVDSKGWRSVKDERLAAIIECIDEITEENRVTTSLCKRVFEACVPGGRGINHSALERDSEANGNPDLWPIRNGILLSTSVKGIPVKDFAHAVAYSQQPVAGSNFVKVRKHHWTNEITGEIETNLIVEDMNISGYLLVLDALLIYNGEDIIKSLNMALECDHDYEVKLIEGPPGCGKTHAILHEYQDGDFVLCPVRESSDDTRSRLKAMHPDNRSCETVVRTVDSFLMHGLTGKSKHDQFRRILADECFMTHAGKWYAAAALLGVSVLQAYGDTKQIPHIPRVQVRKDHVSLKFCSREFNPVTRRCPADSVAAWSELYDNLVRSTNPITNSLFEVNNHRAVQVDKETCLMGMYQADKKEIRKLFPDHDKSGKSQRMIVTAHEAEGKTYKNVVLFRFDRRRRKDKLSLYDQTPHVLVAISRHTHKFVYVRPDGLDDSVSKMIAQSKNPRKIKDILDVSKAGVPYGPY